MFRNNPWQKESKSGQATKNWVDEYAPTDEVEAAYFYDKPGAELPVDPARKHHSKKRSKWPLWVFLTLLVAGGIVGAYIFGQQTAKTRTETETSAKTAAKNLSPTATQTTKQYVSKLYGLSFSYPSTWKVAEDDSRLVVVSPEMSLTTFGDKTAQAHVLISIQNKQSSVQELIADDGTAMRDSEKIAYKTPSTVQRVDTHLSFVRYPANTTQTMDAVYITGQNAFVDQAAVPSSIIITADPLISVRFLKCKEVTCQSNAVPISLLPKAWQTDSFSQQVRELVASIVIIPLQ